MRLARLRLVLPLAALSAVGCAHAADGAARAPDASRSSAEGRPSGESAADAALEVEVESTYARDESLRGERFRVVARKGIVSLDGPVHSLLAKQRALADAKASPGVRAVIDRLSLDRPILDDVELATRVVHALAQNGVTAPYPFLVDAQSGIVQVSGDVGSWQALRVARAVTAATSGVLDVHDAIAVDPSLARTDATLRAEVEDRIHEDLRVEPRGIHVAVDDGVVRLSGVVSGARERSIVDEDAQGPSIRSVDDELRLAEGAAEMQASPDVLPPLIPRDDDIRAAVLDAFAQDRRIGDTRLDVAVSDGEVVLEGAVPDLATRRAANADAENTTGVLDVRDETTLPRSEPSPDDRTNDR